MSAEQGPLVAWAIKFNRAVHRALVSEATKAVGR